MSIVRQRQRGTALRLFVLALGAGLVIALAPADAQSFRVEPTPAERLVAETCLADYTETNGRRSCIGKVSGACLDAVQGTTVEMMGCLAREHAIWDGLLNRAYREAGNASGKAVAENLKKTQRTWIQYRDQACSWFALAYEGGTAAGPAAAQCLMEQTALRAIELIVIKEFFEQR